ncbi:MAG: TetR/AcrR family transcriptional regulator [Candidatus Metalachnospira sp.]|nr:TetR/AcrR family transcriptional regulator [Candidatus Metalachnospira sp.]
MPKSYSSQEKEYIISRLKEEAAKCLVLYGIRHTTVDELVKRVKIPKGTFYLFYPSKETLLFDVILEQHDNIEKQLFDAVSSIKDKETDCEELTDILFGFYKLAEDMPILKMINSDELELLSRKLPKETVQNHLQHDNMMIEHLFEVLGKDSEKDLEIFSSAFRNIYFATLHKNELEDDKFDDSLRLLIRGLVIQLLG